MFYSEYTSLVRQAIGVQSSIDKQENVMIIQPFVKWGPNKSNVPPDVRLQEAADLIHSVDKWNIVESMTVSLRSVKKSHLFGTGKLDELKKLVKKYNGDPQRKV